ncbi:hypothetical protein LOAG_11207 [Loa loa]|uniref:Uncharacterized protein n=1 Tax=Loa loa TaxID=7209 RepID=A0A1S0TNF7_LOALO|nr:hypothetical protein LOAG_11207 [Loa loa]EFO17295.1 hypothetical protein LOAG_11207 [Loa loa]
MTANMRTTGYIQNRISSCTLNVRKRMRRGSRRLGKTAIRCGISSRMVRSMRVIRDTTLRLLIPPANERLDEAI